MSETAHITDLHSEDAVPMISDSLESNQSGVCEVAIAGLQRLGLERQTDPEKIRRLADAIRNYATSVKPEPVTTMDYVWEVGRCMVVPGDFKRFCQETMGLDVETGAYKSYSPGGSLNFYHEVNVMDGIIIDWTAKQFSQDQDKPYPLIYLNGGDEVRASWGPLGERSL